MRIDEAVRGEETGVGDAPHAHLSVVIRDMLDQPIHSVVGVGAFIGVFGAVVMRLVRAHVHKHALRHVAAAHILIDEDEALFFGGEGWTDLRLVVVGAVWSHVVRRSLHDDGIRLRRVFGNVDRGEQTHAIAHGNPVFVFGVVRQGVGELGGRDIGERHGGGLGEQNAGDE